MCKFCAVTDVCYISNRQDSGEANLTQGLRCGL